MLVCGGMHFKHECPVWRQTKAGKAGNALSASPEGEAKAALESKERAHTAKALRASDSEFEKSTCLLANAKVAAPPQWYLDSCTSVHITPCRERFISALSPSRLSIEIADGSEV